MNDLLLTESPSAGTPVALAPANLADLPKADLLNYADSLVDHYAESGSDLLGLAVLSAKLELLAERIKDRTKVRALSEVCSYGKDGVTRSGVLLTVREVGVTYDYSTDPVWQHLNRAVVTATEQRKAQEQFLRALPYSGRMTVDETSGEEYRAYPPARKGAESVTLSIQ